MSNQSIFFKRTNPNAKIPVRATPHSAGYDIFAATTHVEGDRVIVSTGLHTAFPEDHVLLIYARSGFAFKHGIRLLNGVAVIDADYRGEIKLAFRSESLPLDKVAELLADGQRVAQCILTPIARVAWIEMRHDDELPASDRGMGGFGSTGTH